jgi:hypothetical protein
MTDHFRSSAQSTCQLHIAIRVRLYVDGAVRLSVWNRNIPILFTKIEQISKQTFVITVCGLYNRIVVTLIGRRLCPLRTFMLLTSLRMCVLYEHLGRIPPRIGAELGRNPYIPPRLQAIFQFRPKRLGGIVISSGRNCQKFRSEIHMERII